MGPSSHYSGVGGDVSAYEAFEAFGSPADPTTSKARIDIQPVSAIETPTMPSTTAHGFSMPSHSYELYTQHGGFVPGAVSNTMTMFDTSIDGGLGEPQDDLADFDFLSNSYFGTVNPMAIQQSVPVPTAPVGGIGRMYPGAHQALAMNKAHAQKMKQQAIIQQQRQQHQQQHQQQQQQQQQQNQPQAQQFRQQQQQQPQFDQQFQAAQFQQQHQQQPQQQLPLPTTFDPSSMNPKTDQKLNSLLESFRVVQPPIPDNNIDSTQSQPFMKSKKDLEEMDPDELLLASEEGKKLSSKERRQLRNKVSARAFRCRRKDYMAHLEGLIQGKDKRIVQLQTAHDAACLERDRYRQFFIRAFDTPQGAALLNQLMSGTTVPNAPPPKTEQQPPSHEPSSTGDTQSYAMLSPMPQADSADFSMFMESGFDSSEARI